jgi:hypothetical protein
MLMLEVTSFLSRDKECHWRPATGNNQIYICIREEGIIILAIFK